MEKPSHEPTDAPVPTRRAMRPRKQIEAYINASDTVGGDTCLKAHALVQTELLCDIRELLQDAAARDHERAKMLDELREVFGAMLARFGA